MAVQRIGLFGGSFDPVHLGHVMMARAALEELRLARLYIIPAAQSPFKSDQPPAPAAARVQLLRLAFDGQTNCEIDTQELEREGVSFTIDTVHAYADRFSGAELFCLVGADHVPTLPQWREAEALAPLVTFFDLVGREETVGRPFQDMRDDDAVPLRAGPTYRKVQRAA